MNDGNRLLQNISFYPNVSVANRKKIVYISHILKNEKTGFTCYDLFQLSTYNSFNISIQIIVYIMMLLKVTHIRS